MFFEPKQYYAVAACDRNESIKSAIVGGFCYRLGVTVVLALTIIHMFDYYMLLETLHLLQI